MSATALKVPALDSPNVVYSTAYGAPADGCRICGGERAPARPTPKVYCCRTHKKYAARARKLDPASSLPFSGEGVCLYCGATFEPTPTPTLSAICGSPACRKAYRGRGFLTFSRRVKWPHPLAWLAPKINRAPDDPLLARYALALALKGLLVVYVRADGTVGEVGRPKPEAKRRA